MNNPQQIADLIRIQTTLQKVSIRQMLKDIGLGVNSLVHLDNGSMPRADNLGKIADYLNCSVDYLLGRTEVSTGYSNNINNVQTMVNSPQVSGNNTTFANQNQTISAEDMEMLQLIKGLSLVERAKMILFIDEMKNKET